MGIRIFRKSLQLDHILVKFSKISGTHLVQLLLKSSNLTLSKSVNPINILTLTNSFCDSSCLSELNIILKKLKSIQHLCLIIRRWNFSNNFSIIQWNFQLNLTYPYRFDNDDKNHGFDELNKIGPNIYKLLRLKKIRVEFARFQSSRLFYLNT